MMAGPVTTSAWRSTKGGPDRDGCAACIFGVTLPHIGQSGSLHGARVVLLDWDIVSLAQVVLTRGFSTFANWLGTGSCV